MIFRTVQRRASTVGERTTGRGGEGESVPTTWTLLRSGGWSLLVLLGVALIVKLLVVATALERDPLANYAVSDSRYYVERALGLLGRVEDPVAAQPYHLPPLYPWVLRMVPGFGQGAYGGVYVLQALAGTGMLAGVYALARRRMGACGALLATALTLLYGPLSFYEIKLLGDSLATSLLVALLVATDALAYRPGYGLAAVTGALVAAVALLRPQALLLAPALALWVVLRAPRLAPAYAVGLVGLMLPFTLHNARASGDLILISDNGGVNLWLANTGPVSGTFETVDLRFSNIDSQALAAKEIAEVGAGRPLSPGEVSSWMVGRALAEIVARPGRFARRVALRAVALLESFETDIVCIPPVESTTIPPLRVLALPFGLLAGLALAGALLGAHFAGAPRAPIWCVAGMVVLTSLAFFHYSRFRLPLVPLLAMAVGAGCERARAEAVSSHHWQSALLGLLGVLLISWQPAAHHARTLANGWTNLAHARLALAAPYDTAALEGALEDVRRALDHDPRFAKADLVGAQVALLLGRYDEADAHLRAVEAAAPDFPPVLAARTLLAAWPDPRNRHRDPGRARQLLEKLGPAAAADPSLRATLEPVRMWLSR